MVPYANFNLNRDRCCFTAATRRGQNPVRGAPPAPRGALSFVGLIQNRWSSKNTDDNHPVQQCARHETTRKPFVHAHPLSVHSEPVAPILANRPATDLVSPVSRSCRPAHGHTTNHAPTRRCHQRARTCHQRGNIGDLVARINERIIDEVLGRQIR